MKAKDGQSEKQRETFRYIQSVRPKRKIDRVRGGNRQNVRDRLSTKNIKQRKRTA